MARNDHLRTEGTAKKYLAYRATGALETGCPLCSGHSISTFKFWKIILNDFPYDRIAETHHMIIPLRHVNELELTKEEKDEFYKIKYLKLQEYDLIVEAAQRNKSIPTHFHLHLINTKSK